MGTVPLTAQLPLSPQTGIEALRVLSVPKPAYPFRPKSNVHLRPGQFFAVPLPSGRFACGRVMTAPAFGPKDRVGFVVGLMDWIGDQPPTAEDLAERGVLEQAKTRYEAISNIGGEVLGERDLADDGLVADDPNDFSVGAAHQVWGWATIGVRARELLDG